MFSTILDRDSGKSSQTILQLRFECVIRFGFEVILDICLKMSENTLICAHLKKITSPNRFHTLNYFTDKSKRNIIEIYSKKLNKMIKHKFVTDTFECTAHSFANWAVLIGYFSFDVCIFWFLSLFFFLAWIQS